MPVTASQVKPDPMTPPTEASDEAKPEHHDMARDQGDDYKSAVGEMAGKVAMVGGEAAAGEMIVALAIEEAEGMYQRRDGSLEWVEPTDENYHVEISARDAADNRFIPGLQVKVRVSDDSGELIAAQTLPMLWHPWLYHYGANVQLPEDTDLVLEVDIEAPDFSRHDEKNGKRFADDVFVRFEGIRLGGQA